MENSSIRLSVWTEGLDENWGLAPESRGRLERGKMSPKGVAEMVRQTQQFHEGFADCLFILESEGRRLHLYLSSGTLEISDPGNMNYQNVTLGDTDLETYLLERFTGTREEVTEVDPRTSRWLEGILAAAAVAGLVGSLTFLSNFLSRDSQFMPKPVTAEIKSAVESKEIMVRHAGIYVTRVADGEMAIEVNPDGTWGYYDMHKGQPGYFRLQPVNVGSCQPVLENEMIAILTDARFLFYPQNGEKLIFLDRPFKRVGQSRDELPYFTFPETGSKLAGL